MAAKINIQSNIKFDKEALQFVLSGFAEIVRKYHLFEESTISIDLGDGRIIEWNKELADRCFDPAYSIRIGDELFFWDDHQKRVTFSVSSRDRITLDEFISLSTH